VCGVRACVSWLKVFAARKLKRRLFVAQELLATEEHYVKALSIMCRLFYYPLVTRLQQMKKDGTEGMCGLQALRSCQSELTPPLPSPSPIEKERRH
jgi:hypothetical protein